MARTEFLLSQTQGGSRRGQIITHEQNIRDERIKALATQTPDWSLDPTAKGENGLPEVVL